MQKVFIENLSALEKQRKNEPLRFENFVIGDLGDSFNLFDIFPSAIYDENYMILVSFSERQAIEYEYKVKALAKKLYSSDSTEYYYLVMLLNNIRTPGDMSREFLLREGIKILNNEGLQRLTELYNMVQTSIYKTGKFEINNLWKMVIK